MVKILKILFGLILTSFIFAISYQWFIGSESTVNIKKIVDSYHLEKELTKHSLEFLTESPHPMGSLRQEKVRDYILKRLQELNLDTHILPFTALTPNKQITQLFAPITASKAGYNIISKLKIYEKPTCIIALASHYDSKDISEFQFVGANDSASSSILLLDLASFLSQNKKHLNLKCNIHLLWFDGEEAVLPDWNDGLTHPARIVDHTYGSRQYAETLQACSCASGLQCLSEQNREVPFLALILLDMVGFHDLKLDRDKNSHPTLLHFLEEAASKLNLEELLHTTPKSLEDDHIPFKEKGLAVLDIIDFNHPEIWHTEHDRPETVSLPSLELVGKLALYILVKAGQNPEIFVGDKTPMDLGHCAH